LIGYPAGTAALAASVGDRSAAGLPAPGYPLSKSDAEPRDGSTGWANDGAEPAARQMTAARHAAPAWMDNLLCHFTCVLPLGRGDLKRTAVGSLGPADRSTRRLAVTYHPSAICRQNTSSAGRNEGTAARSPNSYRRPPDSRAEVWLRFAYISELTYGKTSFNGNNLVSATPYGLRTRPKGHRGLPKSCIRYGRPRGRRTSIEFASQSSASVGCIDRPYPNGSVKERAH
jgi:hypothetical protein